MVVQIAKWLIMTNNKHNNQLYIVSGKALPKVLSLVLKTKELIETNNYSVSKAVKHIGISRTTYYKYCNDVYYYDNSSSRKTYKIEILNKDKVGTLSKITDSISKNKFNILTINQDKPIKGYSKIIVNVIMTDNTCDITKLVENIKNISNTKEVTYKKISKE